MKLSDRNIYYCKVIQIQPTYVLVNFGNIKGICHISEISDYLVTNINDFFKVGQSYYFLLLNPQTQDVKYKFSYKKIYPKLLRYHYEAIPSISGFDNLYKQTINLINNN